MEKYGYFFVTSKSIQVEFFSVDQNVEKNLKYILTKFELFNSCRFQDIAV